jgi:hypothetical protein
VSFCKIIHTEFADPEAVSSAIKTNAGVRLHGKAGNLFNWSFALNQLTAHCFKETLKSALLLPYKEQLVRLFEPRNLADIALVFLIVYAILKVVRGTRAAPMAAAMAAFALLYWFAVYQDLTTLEFVLRGGVFIARRHHRAVSI